MELLLYEMRFGFQIVAEAPDELDPAAMELKKEMETKVQAETETSLDSGGEEQSTGETL